MSKTGWIILIVCLCLVFCLCAGLFLAGRISTWLFRDRSETRVDTGTTKEYKDLKNDYSADGVYTVQTKDLKELTIDWISGSVIVEITDGEVIRITETASEPIQEKDALRYGISGGKLRVQACVPPPLPGGWAEGAGDRHRLRFRLRRRAPAGRTGREHRLRPGDDSEHCGE